MVMLASVCAASLIPFFFHNVFGRTSKMFIGDGGTLIMGIVMSVFVLNILKAETCCVHYEGWGIGLVPFTLAVLAIPVFDTVRVMSMRILRGTSPFHPDKTHLHHLFISMGFSHIGTTVSILVLNLLVILSWYITYKLGASVDVQFYVVMVMAFLVTFGFYGFMRKCQRKQWAPWTLMTRLGVLTHVERKGLFLWLQRFMDGK
jgi:UDP-N-acetylmuramyl pentapeptide phosphotransferase/UDP-N-acetylglucosamine-1-phosphate transferase